MKKFSLLLALLGFLGLQVVFAQTREISGLVTSSEDGSTIPGASIVVKGTTMGTITDMDGKFTLKVPENATALTVTFVGMKTQNIPLTSKSVYNVKLQPENISVDEVVVTALGIKREAKTLAYASQQVDSKEMNISDGTNIKDALSGKVAGVQIVGQAGSKLGQSGRIRLRGAVSLTTDGDPLYVIDGIPTTDPNSVDMGNVASVNVLKGPNATALYGQRAEYGVIMITTKQAKKGGWTVELNNNTTFDKVAYLPKYQNLYGAGYDGQKEWTTLNYSAGAFGANGAYPYPPEFKVFNGDKFIENGYADESWGPKFDGSDYIAWYNFWPDSPYYGQTSKWVAQPNNVKDFYNTGVTLKNTVTVSGADDNYNARVSYTNVDQNGIIPYSKLKKNMVTANLRFNPTKKLTVTSVLSYYTQEVQGYFNDGYSNQTTGSFNSWFNRNLNVQKLKELADLKTTHGYSASWNYWNPDYGAYFGTEKPAFWYNPYFWLKNYSNVDNTSRLIGKINLAYKITNDLTISGDISTNVEDYSNHYELPSIISNSADPSLYNVYNNGFGNTKRQEVENNYSAMLKYTKKFGDFDIDAMVGGVIRTNSYDRFRANMPTDSKTQGLIIPDVYIYSNTKLPVTAETYNWNKQVNSLYSRASLGYKDFLYLDLTGRKDWSSALPKNNNGYFYPSVGGSFVFSQLLKSNVLSFGKLRGSWAQVGSDVAALKINPAYPLSTSTYQHYTQMYTNGTYVNPSITPALSTSSEYGFDLKFFKNRLGLSATYYSETRQDEIMSVQMSTATGYTGYLTNAGKSRRRGIELVLNATPVQTHSVTWNITFNFAKSKAEVLKLPGDLKSMPMPSGATDDWDFVTITNELGNKWGQLRGRAIKTDAKGNYVINSATGTYDYTTGQYLGSILPSFTGGILNNVTLFNLVSINASIDYQKGGKFFSLSEMWGEYSGLLKETAALNNNGKNVRDPISDGGGVHVVGVDENGNKYDKYMDAQTYFDQFSANTIASPFIHDASYMKLRELGVSLIVPKKILSKTFIKTASIGLVGRNVWMIALAKDNVHRWDPSELSQSYGENAQLPGTRSYGFDVKLSF